MKSFHKLFDGKITLSETLLPCNKDIYFANEKRRTSMNIAKKSQHYINIIRFDGTFMNWTHLYSL